MGCERCQCGGAVAIRESALVDSREMRGKGSRGYKSKGVDETVRRSAALMTET